MSAQVTVQELADRVLEARKNAYADDATQTVITDTHELGPKDDAVVRKVVAEAGLTGNDADEMVRKVSSRVVGRVEALADNLPAASSA